MDKIKSQQILPEQRLVLEALARTAAKPSPRFLELGSWAGDSTVVLGQVAKEHGGKLYCVDWWKGNEDTPLQSIAANEDIFAYFWKRIRESGLEDTVIPIRTSTDNAVELLKHMTFDLVFIDADHRYEPVRRDIRNYAPLVKPGTGILCGHDCEGYIADYDSAFLKKGKNQDCYQTVHCGVVLAVGELFDEYAIDFGVWSVRRKRGKGLAWAPTTVMLPGMATKKQLPPPPFAYANGYNIFRYGKTLFAIPPDQDFLTALETNGSQKTKQAASLKELEKVIGKKIRPQKDFPHLIDSYHEFNLVGFRDAVYGLHHSLGSFDLAKASDTEIEKHRLGEKLIMGASPNEVREQVEFLTPKLIVENYKYFNIVQYRNKFYAVAQTLGAIDDWSGFEFNKHIVGGKCFIAASVTEAETMIELYYKEYPLKETFNWFKNLK